jgi:hypothetical protein
LHRWRYEADRSGHKITRIAVTYEAGRKPKRMRAKTRDNVPPIKSPKRKKPVEMKTLFAIGSVAIALLATAPAQAEKSVAAAVARVLRNAGRSQGSFATTWPEWLRLTGR